MRGTKPTYHQIRQISKARKGIDTFNIVVLKTHNTKDKDIYTVRNLITKEEETIECEK